MSLILSIETATPACSCALSRDGELLLNREHFEEQMHASILGVFVEEMMSFVRKEGLALDAIAVSSGPGSYTGLRIGVSQAKGLSYGLGLPLIAIPTHLIMASMLKERAGEGELLCPMIDARRMEVYAAVYSHSLDIVRETSAEIINGESYQDMLLEHPIYFFGNGADKCRDVIKHPNAIFVDGIHPLASGMVPLVAQAFEEKRFVDPAYFEPFYLKEFVATKPKNKIIPGN